MRQSILYALFSALLTALLLTATQAPAQSLATEVQTHVSLVRTADLDLATQAGQRKLRQRLARAARQVCGAASDSDLKGKKQVRKCRDAAIARASVQRDELLAAAGRGAAIAVIATR